MTGPGASTARMPASLVLAGAGKMGGAMLAGWLDAGLDPRRTTIVDPVPARPIVDLCTERGIALNPTDPEPGAVLVLGIKPQGLDTAAPGLDRLIGRDTLLVSILAGKTVADLRGRLPRARAIVRAMPNLPASIGRGATGACASPEVTPAQRAAAEALLAANGAVAWLTDEAQIDAVTAVSGSGPAYVFLLAETLAEAGIAAGLEPEVARSLARATVAGAGALLDASPAEAAELRRNVTSPGGTTAAALEVLMRPDGLGALMREAVAAARRRAGELSG
ncbi:pyrroline-5-carboxylate reductase [Methylobacterium sp. PvP062]|uniref:Pyrroline-5-carboxylate reductase n=2 Tax=Methylobacterium radiotolerans TaxID=31998 RepID=B1LT34_METRJ|nr:pyrroline-5-carboxylate reductase [Methylobacterium radiotolerans JCM 2831]KZC02722.1 Pyrroline-5-carboxylate reductase [Methylobacterium radiotolerans]PVY97654.1 pyrroline-5-carboxylate reductase [Methylobacterium organophilum]GAN49472.1 pyrroline-5-carboxylate reductase [Methylobacterium sp. ME121]GEM98021.1 pyrroline-5-carboxylate reductase [Methylobacterium radiotolerans]